MKLEIAKLALYQIIEAYLDFSKTNFGIINPKNE